MQLPKETLLDMFWTMLLARRTDERAWVLHRQGKIAFHISGIGQEAAQVGAAFAIKRGCDWVSPYYRDLALMLAMGLTPLEFMLGVMGKQGEPAWHPRYKDGQTRPLTPAQVRHSDLVFMLQSGTPARNTRPTGKGRGRQKGYRPTPRACYPVVFKTKKPQKLPAIC